MRLATILAAAFWAVPCALAVWAYISLLRQARRRDARTKSAARQLQAAIDAAKAENERRRAIHPSGRELVTDYDRELARQNGVLL